MPFRHKVFVEPPGHADPFGHGVHCVRKELDGPVVKLPGAHSLHPPAKPWSGPAYMLSLPQAVQYSAPVAEYLPLAHWSCLPVMPTHSYPAWHGEHASRLLPDVSPPLVNFLLGHVLQRCWPATSEYSWLLPQSLQVDVTLAPRLLLNLPTGHGFRVLVPSHQYPASHWVHAVCVFVVPPCVYDPVGHVLHVATPAVLNLLSEPHSAHDPVPARAAVPATHADAPFSSHVEPAGHTLQTCRVSFVHEYPDRQSV